MNMSSNKIMTPNSTTIKEGNLFLRVDEQDKVLEAFKKIKREADLRDKFFIESGTSISFGVLAAQSFVYWKSCFKGFNLYKYGKHRISTVFFASAVTVNATLVHGFVVTYKLTEHFRRENPLYYGLNSLKGHIISSVICFPVVTGLMFAIAQRAGIIPIPDNFYHRDVRGTAFKYVLTKLKPYSKGMIMTTLAGCSLMFVEGMLEFRDSQNLLAKINRKTVSLREY